DWKTLNTNQRGELASLTLAVPSEQAALYLLRYLQTEKIHPEQLPEYFRHMVRYLPAEKLSEVIQLAQTQLAANLDLQVEIIKAVLQGYQQKGLRIDAALTDWAARLTQTLLAQQGMQSVQWVNYPAGEENSENPWTLQQRASADGKESAPFFCSLPAGERATGRLISQPFSIPPELSFYLAGHTGFPRQPDNGFNYVQLRRLEDQRVLKRVSAPRNDLAQQVHWDLKEFAGTEGYLEVVDSDSGKAYAWLAIGRFQPEVVSIPRESLQQQVNRWSAAAFLVEAFKLHAAREQIVSLLTQKRLDPKLKNELASAVISLDGTDTFRPLFPLPVPQNPAAGSFQQTVIQAVIAQKQDEVDDLLKHAFKRYPSRLQTALAAEIARQPKGLTRLIAYAEQGVASPQLLAEPAIQNQIQQSADHELRRRAKKLLSALPPREKKTQENIAQHFKSHTSFELSVENGKAVFEKNCAVCHQLAGKGAVVGPQLDGIGNRGLERLLEDVLDPNRAVDINFRTTTVITDAGRIFSGLKRREEGAVVVFVDNKGKEFTIAKNEIDEQQQSPLSLMPANLLEILTPQELHDLLAYLLQSTKKETAGH
ncbi:MAG: c-type cytochrome, partial [Planctomycetaceae bacterium]|nr:c-type cytochrome [Planctomycetaceae bacterium]